MSNLLLLFLAITSATNTVVPLYPSDDLQSIIDAHPPGTSFTLAPGVYSQQQLKPKTNMTFTGSGQTSTILTGARLLTSFSRDPVTGLYVAANQTQQGQVHGECAPSSPRCDRPEDFFFDKMPLRHVNSSSIVTNGSYYFDYEHHRILFADDPTGHLVQTSVTRQAFGSAQATNVTISHLSVVMYAAPAQVGAIGGQFGGAGWHVHHVTSTLNHGAGVALNGGTLAHSNVSHNGQQGVKCGGVSCWIGSNEIAHNNYAGFSTGWEAGGGKMAATVGLVVQNNTIHNNLGAGIWTDINNVGAIYEDNFVHSNSHDGIKHEISYRALIRNNVVCNNGYAKDIWLWGSDILVQNSRSVVVANNTVVVGGNGNGIGLIQQNRGNGTGPGYGPHLTINNTVQGNEIVFHTNHGLVGGVADYRSGDMFARSSGNRFQGNWYHLVALQDHDPEEAASQYWTWNNSKHNFSSWQAVFGFDTTGSVDHMSPPGLPVECKQQQRQ